MLAAQPAPHRNLLYRLRYDVNMHPIWPTLSVLMPTLVICGTGLATTEMSFVEAARTVSASIEQRYLLEAGLYAAKPEERAPDFMWGNGVMFSALVAAARHDPQTYTPVMERFFQAMDAYWDTKADIPGYEPAPTPGGGRDKYYDDNQWMVITFMEAHDLTGKQVYLDRAVETLRFSLSGWDDDLGGGIWWHEARKGGGKNTCSNAPAAVACLRVARHRDQESNIDWATRIVSWTTKQLQDEDALFFDHRLVKDGTIGRHKFTYNSALMIRANLGLYHATGNRAFLDEAVRIGTACDAFVRADTGLYRDSPRFTHLLVEADLELHRATGDERFLARAVREGEAAWKTWQTNPPPELIEQASIARMLWLLADMQTPAGRAFWADADRPKPPTSPKD